MGRRIFYMKEKYYDDLLNIFTRGDQKDFNGSLHYHRYEPTPYSALEVLFEQYELKNSDRVVDFGCGKGRLNFYLNYRFQSTVVGIEMNKGFFEKAISNRRNYLKSSKKNDDQIHFQNCLAEEYRINPLDNRFYFFNPFSLQIFMIVLNNILLSVEKAKRDIEIILYYPSEDYIYFLNNHPSFQLKQEVLLMDLYKHNPNERFMIYRLAY
jgi:SAM-dependent methyltransferase